MDKTSTTPDAVWRHMLRPPTYLASFDKLRAAVVRQSSVIRSRSRQLAWRTIVDEITLGDVTITRIHETHGPFMPADQFFPDMPEHAWQDHRDMLVPDHLGADDTMVHVAMQTWLIRSEGKTILIDTGVGNDKTRPAVPAFDPQRRDYLATLARADVRPEDVDLVINTHLHVDHVGWNTRLVDNTWVPTFPNATYLMPRIDFEFWNPA